MDAFAIRNGDAARSLTGGPRGRQTTGTSRWTGLVASGGQHFLLGTGPPCVWCDYRDYSKGREPVSQTGRPGAAGSI